MSENVLKWRKRYSDIIKQCPLNTEQVWDIEFEIRDIIKEKGYGLINFCNYSLIINKEYIGHFNAIDGSSKMIKLLYSQIKSWGYECYYQFNEEKPTMAYIVFPKNLTYEIKEDLYKLKTNINLRK